MKSNLYALDAMQRARMTVLLAAEPDLVAAINRELTLGEAVNQLGDGADNPYVAAAHEHDLLSEGTLEVDARTIVSEGDEGAYVMAWLWIDNEAAGVTPEPTGMEEG